MTLSFHALWMLCALGSVALVTAAGANGTRRSLAAGAGFVAAAWIFGPDRLPDPVVTGVLTAASAAIVLFRPRYAILAAVFGGAMAGMLSALLQVQGLPAFASLPLGSAVLIVPIWLAKTRTDFAPDVLRDEGVLIAGALGVVVASLPGVLDGWQAATNLAATSERTLEMAVPLWTAALLTTSVALGATYSVWSRR